MCCEPRSDVWATIAFELGGNLTLLSSESFTAAKKVPSDRCTASTPETLPTVTSSIITGEFCGMDATSGTSTVMLKEPAPWPAVPGMFNEFSPPNWHPASTTTPEPRATVRTAPRLSLRCNDFRFIRRVPAVTARPAASAGHPRPGTRHRASPVPAPGRGPRAAAGPAVAAGTEDQKTGAAAVGGGPAPGWAGNTN